MEQYLHGANHGLKFAPSQHCSSSDFNPSDLIHTALFNFFFINVGEIIVHFTKLYFSGQLMKKNTNFKSTCCIFIWLHCIQSGVI